MDALLTASLFVVAYLVSVVGIIIVWANRPRRGVDDFDRHLRMVNVWRDLIDATPTCACAMYTEDDGLPVVAGSRYHSHDECGEINNDWMDTR